MKKPNMMFEGFGFALKEIYESKKDFDKSREMEITKRNDSDNRTKENIERIHAQKELYLKQIEGSLDLKKGKTCKTFEVIDHALESGDLKQLELALNAMVQISEDTHLLSDTQKYLVREDDDVIDI